MRAVTILSAVAAVSAFIIPDQQTLESLSLENQEHQESEHPFWEDVQHNAENFWDDLEEEFIKASGCAKHKFSEVADSVHDTAVRYTQDFQNAFAGDSWLETADHNIDVAEDDPPPHHGPPHHGPPGHRPPPRKGGPHHPPHHWPPNATIYELISKSKYTTKLAAAIDEFPDLVEMLNGTKANYTLFAPTDKAFEKIPKHAPKPPKEFLKKLLTYHVSPAFYPAGRILMSHTVPTALEAELIGKVPQRISTTIGLSGLRLNFYSRVIAIDIFASNGVIHGIDSILLPPPKVVDILSILPGEFSTLDLALQKTGLFDTFNDSSSHHGGTLFAPSNSAFEKLGPRINAFLFSRFGLKYLKALILYHVGDGITLYSDAIYKIGDSAAPPRFKIPKGVIHVDLPTALDGKTLSVDISRWARFITIKINGFNKVSVLDGVAADGVVHVLSNVLIPAKIPGGPNIDDDNMSLEEFKARLAPFVEESDDSFQWIEDDAEL